MLAEPGLFVKAELDTDAALGCCCARGDNGFVLCFTACNATSSVVLLAEGYKGVSLLMIFSVYNVRNCKSQQAVIHTLTSLFRSLWVNGCCLAGNRAELAACSG